MLPKVIIGEPPFFSLASLTWNKREKNKSLIFMTIHKVIIPCVLLLLLLFRVIPAFEPKNWLTASFIFFNLQVLIKRFSTIASVYVIAINKQLLNLMSHRLFTFQLENYIALKNFFGLFSFSVQFNFIVIASWAKNIYCGSWHLIFFGASST